MKKKMSNFLYYMYKLFFFKIYLKNKESLFVYYEVIILIGAWSTAIKPKRNL